MAAVIGRGPPHGRGQAEERDDSAEHMKLGDWQLAHGPPASVCRVITRRRQVMGSAIIADAAAGVPNGWVSGWSVCSPPGRCRDADATVKAAGTALSDGVVRDPEGISGRDAITGVEGAWMTRYESLSGLGPLGCHPLPTGQPASVSESLWAARGASDDQPPASAARRWSVARRSRGGRGEIPCRTTRFAGGLDGRGAS